MKGLYKYIYLNIYTILLDLLVAGLVILLFLVPFFHENIVCLVIGILSVMVLFRQALILHGTSGEKNRAFDELNEHNASAFDPESYAKYMNAPCTRRVVTLSLKHLGKSSSYPSLKAMYQERFFTPRRQTRFKITFFENNQPVPPGNSAMNQHPDGKSS